MVREEDYSRGIELLKNGGYIVESADYGKNVETVFVDKDFDRDKCPFCQSENTSINKVPGVWTIILIFVFRGPLPILKKSYKCFDCNKEWKFRSKK
jgi:hypothetical protein